MKNLLYSFIPIALLTIVIMSGCDKVDEPLVVIDRQLTTDDLLGKVYYDTTDSTTSKHVLLEEFTGHLCTNCPEAALAAHEWAEESDHRLIIYSIHAGNFAALDPEHGYGTDFTCPTGNALFADFQVWGNPTAMIDRVTRNTIKVLQFGIWQDVINEEMVRENVIDLKIQNIYYPADSNENLDLNTLEINILATIKQPLEGKYKLAVVLVEDHLLSMQKNEDASIGPSPDWPDFDHRNVLRDAVNGTYGGYITADGTVTAGQSYGQKFYYDTFDPDWVIANCNVIAYIYEESTFEVQQVVELGIPME